MKKILAILSILLLTFGMSFGATETATVTLKATVAETTLNSGIRVKTGDLSDVITNATTFEANFNSSYNSVIIDAGEVSTVGVSGYFSVLVMRSTTSSAIVVEVNAIPMKNTNDPPQYLGFKITKKGDLTAFIDTTSDPTTVETGLFYTATNVYGDGFIKDTKVFKYEVPQNSSVPLGEYSTDISFSITIE